jgi:hypothetical protein
MMFMAVSMAEELLLLLDLAELGEQVARKGGDELADPLEQLFLDPRIGAEEVADQEQRQDEQGDDRQDGVQRDRCGLVGVAVCPVVADGVLEDLSGGCEAEVDAVRPPLFPLFVPAWVHRTHPPMKTTLRRQPCITSRSAASAASISAAPIP